jgi:tetratricopeptide (TPR) repeat protein
MSLPDAERWRRLSPLLDQLLDLPPADRPARLAALQQAHPDLADALAGLLADGGQAQFDRFLTGAVPASAGGAAPGQGSGAGLAGTRLGAYLLEAPLGQGGSGSVWRARREDGRFEGHVAIKLLHLSQLGQAGAERFRREGSILARLAHPHIARLLDAGVAEGGQPYLVIELVQGQRLDRHCDAQQLSVPQRLRLFIDVLQAVAHAHGHLVVHRDIKPSNILVTPDGTVKLLDFGIAKLLDADSAAGPTTDLTRDWGRAMTPEYAAPEQLRGEPVTTATDVYALGVLLYELLSGRLPFPGRRRGAAAQPAADDEPPRPSTVATDAARRKQLAGDLDTIVLRSLKAAPADRYPTVSALLDDIQRHLAGRPVLARADSVVYRLRKWVGRHRAASAVAAAVVLAMVGGAHAQVAVLLALAAGTLLALWQARKARAQAASALQAQQRAEQVKQFIASIFTEATPREGTGGVVTAIDLLASASVRIEVELGASPAVAGELGVLVGASCSRLGDLTRGLAALEPALPRCRAQFGDRHPITLRCRVLLLEALNGASQYGQARSMAPALLADLRAQLPAQADLLVFALQESSFALAKLQQVEPSLAPLHEAMAVAEAHLGLLHDDTLRTLGLLSNTFGRFGRHAEALRTAELALQRTRQALGPVRPHTRLVDQERWYADALARCGRPADAEPIARQAVADQRALDSAFTRRVVNAMASHAVALADMGRTEEAIATARSVVARHAELSPLPSEDTIAFCYRYSCCLLPTRRLDEIGRELDRAEALYREVGDEPALAPLRRQRMRAQLRAWAGDAGTALAWLDALDQRTRIELGLEWPRVALVRAMALRLAGDFQAALSAAREAVDRCTAADAPQVDHGHARTEWACLLLEVGDLEGASAQLAIADRHYDDAQVLPSLLRCDAMLCLGRLHLLSGRRDEARQALTAVEALWAQGHPGSPWHLQAQDWLGRAAAP